MSKEMMGFLTGIVVVVLVVIALFMARCRHDWEEKSCATAAVIRRWHSFHPILKNGVAVHQKCRKCDKEKGWFVTQEGKDKLNPGYALSVIKGEYNDA